MAWRRAFGGSQVVLWLVGSATLSEGLAGTAARCSGPKSGEMGSDLGAEGKS